MKARLVFLFILLCGLAGAITSTWLNQRAVASRNSSGTETLPNGPFVPGTTISSTVMNSNFNDVTTEITNSLDRLGRGGMSAPLQLAAGTISAPGLTLVAEPTTGLYRAASNDIRFAVAGVDSQKWTSSGPVSVANAGFGGRTPATFQLETNDAASGDTLAQFGTLFPMYIRESAGGSSINFNFRNSAGTTTYGVTGYGGSVRLNAGTGNVEIVAAPSGSAGATVSSAITAMLVSTSGVTIGSSGTAISASYGASYTFSFGSLTAGTPVLQAQTLTGVATGGVCDVSVDGNIGANALSCYVSAANTIQIKVVPVASNTLNSGTYRVRVFQP